MATQLVARNTPGVSFPEWLDSDHYRFLTGGVTLGANTGVIPSGTVIARNAITGLWAAAVAAPAAGTQLALLWERVDTAGGNVSTGAIDHGRVVGARLPAAITAGQASLLNQITVR